ncbi:hypothetical protein H9P43_003671 [Blastocladiella emersonii ATCC 22665]|nr:hypothetical protein H9P43_003671 [Blastocladiella emersonii ATCC 22665]
MAAAFCPPGEDELLLGSPDRPIDLSYCFQLGVLQPAVLAAALLGIAGRYAYLRSRPHLDPHVAALSNSRASHVVLRVKRGLAFAAAAIAAAHLVVESDSTASNIADVARIIAYVAASHLHEAECLKSTQPSTALTWTYLLDVVVNGIMLRSLILDQADLTWTVARLAVAGSLLVLESVSVRGSRHVAEQNHPPEFASTLISRIMFFWAAPLVRLGNRKYLELADLWQLHPRDRVERGVTRFLAARTANPNASLARVLVAAFGWSWLGIASLYMGSVLSSLVFPYLLQLLLRNVADAADSISRGILIAAAYLVVFVVSELSGDHANALGRYAAARITATLSALVYAKALRAPITSDDAHSAVLNHMQIDAGALGQGIEAALPYPLRVATLLVSFAWLWNTMGSFALIGIAVLVAFIPINTVVGKVLLRLNDAKMANMDRRVSAAREAVLGIKTVKLSGWTDTFLGRIAGHRARELAFQRRVYNVEAVLYTLFFLIPPLSAFAMFAAYAASGRGEITVELVFVTLSAIGFIKGPLYGFIWSLQPLISGVTAYKRLAAFLSAPDRDEYVEQLSERGAIRVRGGTFKWASRDDGVDESTAASTEPTPRDINLDIAPGSLVMVVGSVGSSKSSLLSALLGDIPLVSGTVGVGGRASYVSQRPWILNDTIRNNVTFGLAFDADQYARAVHACALDRDLAAMPLGDRTLIGERGLTLSKGQQVRLTCARAAYACVVSATATNSGDASGANPCALLDDVLGSVDVRVDHHLFEHLIEGVLKNTTRVLVTHALHHVHRADHVVVCSRGTIIEQGPPAELMAIEGGVFAAMVREYQAKRVDAPPPTLVDPETAESRVARCRSARSTHRASKALDAQLYDPTSPSPSPSTPSSAEALIPAEDCCDDDDEEGMRRGSVDWAVYLQYARYIGVPAALGHFVLIVGSIASETVANYWAGHWGESGGAGDAGFYLGVLGTLNGSIGLFTFAANWVFACLAVKAALAISTQLAGRVLRLPLSFFDTTPSGRVMNRFAKDISTIDATLPNIAYRVAHNAITATIVITTILVATPHFALVLVPLAFGFHYYASRFIRVGRELQRIEAVTTSPMYQVFSETLDGLSTIRAHGQSARYLALAHERTNTHLRAKTAHLAVHQWLKRGLKMIAAVVIFAAALLAVLFPGQGAVLIGLSLTQAQEMAWVLDELVDESCQLEQEAVSVERIQEYLDLPPEETCATIESDALWPADGRVEFAGYAARYRPELPLVLSDLDLSVAPGEKVCLVGRTGSGKSSTVLALLRGFEAAAGSIRIDGVNIAAVPLDVLRSRVTILPQDAFIFGGSSDEDEGNAGEEESVGSVRANVDPYGAMSDAEIWRALEAVHLADHIRSLPRGLDEPAKGALSVGQAQLLCLARAVIRKSRILILDESTANTDHTTDALVQATIREQFRDCTVICIAHRIGTVLDYDTVLYLDHGRIVERGSPSELIRQPESRFYSLAKQSGLVAEHDE